MSAICSQQSHQMPHFSAKNAPNSSAPPDSLPGREGASCPSPKIPPPLSAFGSRYFVPPSITISHLPGSTDARIVTADSPFLSTLFVRDVLVLYLNRSTYHQTFSTFLVFYSPSQT